MPWLRSGIRGADTTLSILCTLIGGCIQVGVASMIHVFTCIGDSSHVQLGWSFERQRLTGIRDQVVVSVSGASEPTAPELPERIPAQRLWEVAPWRLPRCSPLLRRNPVPQPLCLAITVQWVSWRTKG